MTRSTPLRTTGARPAASVRDRRGRGGRRGHLNWALPYLPLVRGVAGRLRGRVPYAELDDLVSAGTVGLLEAAERYDPARGTSFATFAYPRILGAMLDELRRLCARDRSVELCPLDASVSSDDCLRLVDVTEDVSAPQPSLHAELTEVLEAVERLPEREREVLVLHASGYTVAEIGTLHGYSGARASQLLVRARLRLEQSCAA